MHPTCNDLAGAFDRAATSREAATTATFSDYMLRKIISLHRFNSSTSLLRSRRAINKKSKLGLDKLGTALATTILYHLISFALLALTAQLGTMHAWSHSVLRRQSGGCTKMPRISIRHRVPPNRKRGRKSPARSPWRLSRP